MKKQYIKPTTDIYTLNPVRNIFSGSTVQIGGNADGEHDGGDDGNTDSREDNFNNSNSVWDNAW